MLAAIGGRTDVVRILTAAGAELCLRGTGTRPSRRNQPSPSLEVTPRWLRSCAPVLHIDPNDKKPAFRNRIFMEGGASEADIATARAGVHSRTWVPKFGEAWDLVQPKKRANTKPAASSPRLTTAVRTLEGKREPEEQQRDLPPRISTVEMPRPI